MNYRSLLHKLLLTAALAAAALSPLFGGAFSTSSVQAQQPVTLESVRVDVWPEYDRPSVLVIYNVTLSPSVSLPASLVLRIPTPAGEPHAVAMQDANNLYDLQYTLAGAGEWIEVRMTTPVPQVRIEYYDPSLLKADTQRDFTFTWQAAYTVENLSVMVQQPVNASEMVFRPGIGEGRVNTNDGLTYYTLVTGEVPANTPLTLEMSYEKPDDTLTQPQQFQPVQPVQPVDSATPGRVTLLEGFSMTPLQLGMLGVGLLLIVGGLAWYLVTARVGRQAQARAQGGGRKRHKPSQRETPETGEAVFCHQCGKRAGPGDAFCRTCGTKLR